VVKPGFHSFGARPEHADCSAGGTSVTEVPFRILDAGRDHQRKRRLGPTYKVELYATEKLIHVI